MTCHIQKVVKSSPHCRQHRLWKATWFPTVKEYLTNFHMSMSSSTEGPSPPKTTQETWYWAEADMEQKGSRESRGANQNNPPLPLTLGVHAQQHVWKQLEKVCLETSTHRPPVCPLSLSSGEKELNAASLSSLAAMSSVGPLPMEVAASSSVLFSLSGR